MLFVRGALLSVAVVAGSLTASQAQASTPQELATQAAAAYAQRDYTVNGEQHAREAGDLYGQAAAASTVTLEKATYLNKRAEALYFVGGADDDRNVKKDVYQQGLQAGAQAAALLGVSDVRNVSDAQKAQLRALPAAQLTALNEALYQRGINLGQWGQANGIAESISRWPELKDNIQLVIDLGAAAIHEYGPYRTLGLAYHKLPGLLGGSNTKANQYLSVATQRTMAKDSNRHDLGYSVNGYNSVYWAEVLIATGHRDQAVTMLQAFMRADPTTLLADFTVENRKAQQEAQDLLNQ